MQTYEYYLQLTQGFEMYPIKYNNFHHYLQYLENQNFIRLSKEDKEVSVGILIPTEVIEEEFSNRAKRIELSKKIKVNDL